MMTRLYGTNLRPQTTRPTTGYSQGSGGGNPVSGGVIKANEGRSPIGSGGNGSQETAGYTPNYAPTELPYLPGMTFGNDIPDINRLESKSTAVGQEATNVFTEAKDWLLNPLARLSTYSREMLSSPGPDLQTRLSLGRDIQGASALRNALSGGVDYFGRLGLSEGLQNLRAQENSANRALTAQLGRNPANASLIAALQNQNRMRTQLAYNPLLSEAQRGTYERAYGDVGLENQRAQLLNSILSQEANFRNQSELARLQSQLAQMQPTQSLIEALTALQGQARGVSSTERVLGGKNYT